MVRSWLKAARSAADRKRITVSIDRVGKRFSVSFGTSQQCLHLAHDAGGKREEIAGGKAVGAAVRVGGDGAHGARRDDVRCGAGHHEALGEPSPLTLFRDADQLVGFERPQMIVDLLTRDAHSGGEGGGGGGFGQFREQAAAHRFERDHRRGRIVNDFDCQHPRNPSSES